MLKIWLGNIPKGCIVNPSSFFDLHRPKNRPWSEDMIRAVKVIDDLDYVGGDVFKNSLGKMLSPDVLSSGCKSVLLLYMKPSLCIYATRCGDNCAPFILDIADKNDVTIALHHPMLFPRDFEGVIMDNGKEIHCLEDYYRAYLAIGR